MKNDSLDWDESKINAFQKALVGWYESNKRILPWRENNDPYRIWVSEVMLQQTKVDTVIPYFERFMTTFPTMRDFAEAEEAAILKIWEGLGYYSRVRNLQKAMQQVLLDHAGKVPSDLQTILSLKGVGPYTAGAILSIAYEQAEPAIDGNVMRVMSRVFKIDADIMKPATRKLFDRKLRPLLAGTKPSSFNQGLMEVGALICTPKQPMCLLCPLNEFCEAHQDGTELDYPVKIKKTKVTKKKRIAVIATREDGKYLIEQRPNTGLLAGLWQFPTIDITEDLSPAAIKLQFLKEYHLDIHLNQTPVTAVKHIFSHLVWNVDVYTAVIDGYEKKDSWEFVREEELEQFAFPVPYQKMWRQYKEENND